MAPMKTLNSNYSSSNYGEDIARQANVLASCYVVDAAGSLKGLHYCTTLAAGAFKSIPFGPSGIPEVPISGLPSPPSSPPLAAFTSSNELAVTPKPKRNTNGNGTTHHSAARGRRGGATLRIREECERFFCETMSVVFHGEGNSATRASGLTGVYQHHEQSSTDRSRSRHDIYADESDTGSSVASVDSGYFGSYTGDRRHSDDMSPCERPATGSLAEATAWMEIWDYQGGASFRAFVAEDLTGEKALFTFFDAGIVGRDLKKALVALIELAETPLECSRLVVCVDRAMEPEEMESLTKGLQWAGFELDMLDQWAGIRDVTSDKWLFMGMEV